MEQYKSNSNSSREKEKDIPKKKNIEKVTKGAARTKKKSKFLDSFIAEDVKDVKDYLIGDVLVPTIKSTIAEMVSNGVDMYLFGEVRHGRKKSQRGNRTPYRDYYDRRDDRRRESRRGAAYDFESVIVESRGEAELVLDRMDEIIDNYLKMINEEEYDKDLLKELLAFGDTSKQPSRIKCATLSANGIKKYLENENHS